MTRIAFIGLGNIGFPLAQNLLAAGHDMNVYDLDSSKAAPLAAGGARVAGSLGDAIRAAEVVVTSLPGPRETKAVFEAPDGLLARMTAGQAWIEMSTTDAAQLESFASQLAARGIDVLEAPVTGGVVNAYKGAITIFVSGAAAAYDRHRPLFDPLAAHVIYLGALGNALVVKLISNMLAFIHGCALGEGLLLGTKAGIPAAALLEALRHSYAGSFVADVDGPRVLAGTYDSAFALDLALKDQRLTHGIASDLNVPLELSALATAALERAKARWGGDADCLLSIKGVYEGLG